MLELCSHSCQPPGHSSISRGHLLFLGCTGGWQGPAADPLYSQPHPLPPAQPRPPAGLHPRILHVAMQTRGCQALRRQWLPCVPAQGVGPWYGPELRPAGTWGAACPLRGHEWVGAVWPAVLNIGPPVASLLGRPESHGSVCWPTASREGLRVPTSDRASAAVKTSVVRSDSSSTVDNAETVQPRERRTLSEPRTDTPGDRVSTVSCFRHLVLGAALHGGPSLRS